MKRIKILLSIYLLLPFFALSQVGIGTISPNAQLDIQSSNQAVPSNTDGILIPKVDEFPATAPGANQDGMLLYVTGNGSETKGFYYWNNTSGSWITIVGTVSAVTRLNELSDARSDDDGSNDGSSIFLGLNAGMNDNGTHNRNIGIGRDALQNSVSGYSNIAIGLNSMQNVITASSNIGIGDYTFLASATGGSNIGIGVAAMRDNLSGFGNVAMGSSALVKNTTGFRNVALGYWALNYNETGANNIGIGFRTLGSNVDGFANVAVGYASLFDNISGHRNVAVGYGAGGGSLGDENVFIGYNAGFNETGSDRLYIENSGANSSGALIYGEFDNNLLRINGSLNIMGQYAFPLNDGSANQVLQTDGSGTISWSTLSDTSTASNGLSMTGSDIRLGGNLSENTIITQGANHFTLNLNSSGDFIVQDNGIDHFKVTDIGTTQFGGNSYWYASDINGTAIARISNSGNNGLLNIYNNGLFQHVLHGTATSVINETGGDYDFRIEGDNNAFLFYVDAGNDRIGLRTASPAFDLHLKQSNITATGAAGIALESSATTNNWKIYHSGSHISFAENGVRRAYITAGTGVYVQTSDRRLKKDIVPFGNVLSKLSEIKTYSYRYLDQQAAASKTLGVMAQEVQPQFPELVEADESGNLGMNYAGLSVVALQAIKEQQAVINAQQQEIDQLKKDIEAIKTALKFQ